MVIIQWFEHLDSLARGLSSNLPILQLHLGPARHTLSFQECARGQISPPPLEQQCSETKQYNIQDAQAGD